MIEVKELTKFYGDGENRFQVLKNISLKIAVLMIQSLS